MNIIPRVEVSTLYTYKLPEPAQVVTFGQAHILVHEVMVTVTGDPGSADPYVEVRCLAIDARKDWEPKGSARLGTTYVSIEWTAPYEDDARRRHDTHRFDRGQA